jgi:hypothetical protein
VVTITIRHVPVHVRDEIARRAQLRGQSTGECVRELLSSHAGRPDKGEVLARAKNVLKHWAKSTSCLTSGAHIAAATSLTPA